MNDRARPRRAEEEALLEELSRRMPAGARAVSADPGRAFVVRGARGSRLWDCSGNEYVDYLLGSGPHFLGHAHPAVLEAVRGQIERGTSYLVASEPSVRLASAIADAVPGAEKVTLHSSGSEATFYALRLARAYTGRTKVLKFEGGFHGMHDCALMSNQWTFDPPPFPRARANSHGIPPRVQEEVLVAPFNDTEQALAILEAHRDELAAVIVEPVQRTFLPRAGFLEALREATRRHGIVLVFDEMVTGFRVAFGGAQQKYGVTADLCAFGKVLSAGFPLGVLSGSGAIMELADPARGLRGEAFTMQTGTFCGNPVSATAALAVLDELRRPGLYEGVERTGRRLMHGLQQALDDAGVAVQVLGEPSFFEAWFCAEPVVDHRSSLRADPARRARFADLLLDRGILKAHEKFFVSTAHGEDDVDRTLEAFREAARDLPEAGASDGAARA